MGYKAVLFDLDGTLLNTLEDLADSVNCALAELNCPARTIDEVRRFIGNGVKNLIRLALPADRAALAPECLRLFTARYSENMNVKTAPYPGITELLRALKARGVKIGVLSNKRDAATKALCAEYFGELCDIAFGERDGVPKKPAPDAVYEIMASFGVTEGEMLYSGDSDVDVMTARNAGLAFLGVSWGFRSKESLIEAGAELVIDEADAFLPAMDAQAQKNGSPEGEVLWRDS